MAKIEERDIVVAVRPLGQDVAVGDKGIVFKVEGFNDDRYVVEFTKQDGQKVFLADLDEKNVKPYQKGTPAPGF